jgi:hypothetical protein
MNQLNLSRGRAGAIGADLTAAADALTHARGALDAFRRSVFDSLSGSGSGSGAWGDLPAYAPQPGNGMSGLISRHQRLMYFVFVEDPVTMPRGPDDGNGMSWTLA